QPLPVGGRTRAAAYRFLDCGGRRPTQGLHRAGPHGHLWRGEVHVRGPYRTGRRRRRGTPLRLGGSCPRHRPARPAAGDRRRSVSGPPPLPPSWFHGLQALRRLRGRAALRLHGKAPV
ncbi:MAG: IAA acetyltransferase, partial [uncultured Rubellimicrobium sp.]